MLRQALLLLVLSLVPAIGQALLYRQSVSWNAPPVAKDEIELVQAQNWGEAVLWVDARPDAQFEADHIPGAHLLNEDRWGELLPQFLGRWSPDRKTVVYCSSQSCAASHEVARRLREEAQLMEVYVLHGGWEAYRDSRK